MARKRSMLNVELFLETGAKPIIIRGKQMGTLGKALFSERQIRNARKKYGRLIENLPV